MSEKVTFYYNPMSRAAIVHWMLEEAEADFDFEIIDFDKGDNRTEAFLQLNPMGKLPVIAHRGTVVTEAAAICAYLADAFPANGLAPAPTAPERGAYYRWLFFGAGCIEPATLDKAFKRPPVGKPSSVGYGTYERTFDTLHAALSKGRFLLGKQFTAADVYIAAQLDWGMGFNTIESRPAFKQYVAACQERLGYQRFSASHQKLIADMQ